MRLLLLTAFLLGSLTAARAPLPELVPKGDAVQLHVDGEPFLILGGELGNSTASDLSYLAPHWESFRALGMNTVLAPVSWEMIEPEEGEFDFAAVDGLIEAAREAEIRLVLLWFGTWKNSMSTYVPAWVKRDQARFVRARQADGAPLDILSPHVEASWEADARAFRALMAHLARTDRDRTVLMVQVENEVGMIPEARDRSAAAEADWQASVPDALTAKLREGAAGEALTALWEKTGRASSGSWREVFGESAEAEEVFTAWHLASYVEHVAAAGLQAYDLPLYVNAALQRPGAAPGGYPAGGPLPHLFAVWQAAAPSIDMLSPDIYFEDFVSRVSAYDVPGNAVFVPEANRTDRAEAAADAFFAVGALGAIGFSPFSIENVTDEPNESLAEAYRVLGSLAPMILEHQGDGSMVGLKAPVAYDGTVAEAPQAFALGGYDFTATMVDPWMPKDTQDIAAHGGLVISLGEGEFLAAGRGVTLTFVPSEGGHGGIEVAREGEVIDGEWRPGRWMNGDQTHQGRHVRLPPDSFSVQRFTLYSYE
ncbi:DUF5597 domain-containing protein [Parvularcula dongshanensis]|uniref:Beta-galactosidase GanA n=1 Tax=Parvularcula dongshanensis TaxID=1173995 RepID=A0A840I516_9PROT|nr:DUF5597 domain-containing protein [Parvularcula dongshanensis]MBB4659462.1 beta-galactosidase GanA [Parvularcula dongshanensis]